MMGEDEIFLLRLEAKLEREQFKARAQPSTLRGRAVYCVRS